MISKKMKEPKGVTLVALTITVTIILILTSAIIYNVRKNISIYKLEALQNDIMNLRDKVSSYYAQYGALPIVNGVEYTNISKIMETGVISDAVDTGNFYVIKLSSLDNLTLTYGEDFEKISKNEVTTAEQINGLEDLYIINEDSHNIFYARGVTVDNERFHTDYMQDKIDKESIPIVDVSLKPGKMATSTEKDNYNDGSATATIPEGFTVSNIEGEKTVAGGLVIYDIPESEVATVDWSNPTSVQETYNQFVWIPVDNSSDEEFNRVFKRTEGYKNQKLDSKMDNCGEADASGTNSKITEDDSTVAEAKVMYASVKKYGGFYIGRYEAGIEGDTKRASEAAGIGDEVVIKKNKHIYNYIGWSSSDTMTVVTGGAVEKSRNMTFANSKIKATPTLCYGVQWDAALNFIDPAYITNEVDGKPDCDVNSSYVANSLR